MRNRVAIAAFTIALVAFAAVGAASAEECALKQFGSFDIPAGGAPFLPATVHNAPVKLYVSLSSTVSGLPSSFVEAQHLIKQPADSEGISMGNVKVTHVAQAPVAIGSLQASSFNFFVIPKSLEGDEEGAAEGMVGLDILTRVDIEFDLGHRKLNLFSQDHCRGKVVYWSAGMAAIPMRLNDVGVHLFKMELDGQPIDVTLAPEHSRPTMPLSLARKLFSLDKDSPGMTELPGTAPGGMTSYLYRFKSLGTAGLTVANPAVVIYDDARIQCAHTGYQFYWESTCGHDHYLRLGRSILNALRIYVAFGEKTIYLTPANAQ